MPPSWLLAAQGLVQLSQAVIALLVVFVAGVAVFGALAPKSPGGLVLSIMLSIAGLFPIGLTVAATAGTASAANVLGRVLFFRWSSSPGRGCRARSCRACSRASATTPRLARRWKPSRTRCCEGSPAGPLLVLAAYLVVSGFLARRFFRWD